MCHACVNIHNPPERIDSRWHETSDSCPDEKKEWILAVKDLNGVERGLLPRRYREEIDARLIKAADAARLAMLAAYDMEDLYFEPTS